MKRRHTLTWAAALPALVRPARGQAVAPTVEPWVMHILDAPPFGMLGASGRVAGVMADLGHALAREAGREIDMRLVPIARVLKDVNTGEAGLTILLPVQGLDPGVHALATLARLDVELLPRKGLAISDRRGVRGMRIASLGRGAGMDMMAQLEGAVHQRVNSLPAMVGMLHAGRVDAVVSVKESLRYTMEQGGLRPSDFGTPLVLGRLDLTLFATPSMPLAERQRLAMAANTLTRSGEFARVLARYATAP
ncbi:substrate-binding periplasmic protein [Roseateles sp. BYS87W]|uniref:Substrate-binding periplasmic protein n=1 Tax=Pelomonas baiyunensis TaxID=3299026 RepID=A0ABW7H176_9BURK